MKKILIITMLFLLSCMMSKNSFYLRSYVINDDFESLCFYKDTNGKIIGNYLTCYTDTLNEYAIIKDLNYNLIGIDRNGKFLYKVYATDNGPDYVSEGLFRILVDDKIGFANAKTGKVDINPLLDYAYPFKQGLSAFCINCFKVKDSISGHSYLKGGKWGFIDKTGRIIIIAVYDYVESFDENGLAKVKKDNIEYTINVKGEVQSLRTK